MLAKARRDAEFAAFVQRSSPALLRLAWALTGSDDAAQELVQASLVKAYVAWPRIRREDALAYTRKIIATHRIDTWRRTRREVKTDAPPEQPGVDAYAGSIQRDELVRLLFRLPERQRKVIVLRYYADLPEAAVAETLGISVGGVKSAASRGLSALRELANSDQVTDHGAPAFRLEMP